MAKKVILNVSMNICALVEGEGKLDLDQLKQSVVDYFSEDHIEQEIVDQLTTEQDEFEGSMWIGKIQFPEKKKRRKRS